MVLWPCIVCRMMYFSCRSWDYIELDRYTPNRIQEHFCKDDGPIVRNDCKHLLVNSTVGLLMLQKSHNKHQLTIHFSLQIRRVYNTFLLYTGGMT
ncbi:hypothetical protein N7447_001939 [Penicillium robsamsonii]|uniref:uncharacterized protein n=1 Tax=Penicillium robsamsonii TaxID=1792511 RepID=UPI002546CC1C|nr:uncharacterized protein N7447_001939 [Penicillium robsamsonii]KAJ5835913.1 hypothetical protein N7447_001939 [Penicillium robsamsonii]